MLARPATTAMSATGAKRQQAQTAGLTSRSSMLFHLDEEGAFEAPQPASKPQAGGSSDVGLLDEGWGVVVPSAANGGGTSSMAAVAAARSATKKVKRQQQQQLKQQAAAVAGGKAAPAGGASSRSKAGGFVGQGSQANLLGMTMLRERLRLEGKDQHSTDQKAAAAAAAEERRQRFLVNRGVKKDWVAPDELDEGEAEAQEHAPVYELKFDSDGSTEFVKYDDQGNVVRRVVPGQDEDEDEDDAKRQAGGKARALGIEDDDDPLAFLSEEEEDGERGGSGAASGRARRGGVSASAPPPTQAPRLGRRRAAVVPGVGLGVDGEALLGGPAGYDEDDDSLPGRNPLADEEVEWGLDELSQRPQSLMQQFGIIKPKQGAAAQAQGPGAPSAAVAPGAARQQQQQQARGADGDEGLRGDLQGDLDMAVTWGGGGAASGIDMEEQEALLSRIFKPHKVKTLMAHQRQAEQELAAMKKRLSGRTDSEGRPNVNGRLRIIAGEAQGRALANGTDGKTRPMMEKVRQAIFNMIQSQAGTAGGLPPARWLDLFAGTGSVGLEALSRGIRECHFIELDPYIAKKVLGRNIVTCGFQRQSVVHTMKAEEFLRKSIAMPRFAGGTFDFLSVCPPYLLVSYPELFGLLERSPLLHAGSLVFVEYPSQLADQVPATLGPLVTVRDRKYGRTLVRVYGPGGAASEGGEEGDELRGLLPVS